MSIHDAGVQTNSLVDDGIQIGETVDLGKARNVGWSRQCRMNLVFESL